MEERYGIRVYKEYFRFNAAHFLLFDDGEREPLHGHNYQVRVAAEGAMGGGDVVMDFIPFKPLVKELCDQLHHRMLLPREHPDLAVHEDAERVEARHRDGSWFCWPRGDVLVLPLRNTSTELLARYLGHRLLATLPTRLPEARIQDLEVQVEESRGQSGFCRLEADASDLLRGGSTTG